MSARDEWWVMKHAYSVVLLPVSGQILRDPGPLCAGENVTLTCDISGFNLLTWSYDGFQVISILPGFTTLSSIRMVSGVEFTVLDTQMDTVSHIIFVASAMMSGRTLECIGNGVSGSVTFQVEPIVGKNYPSHDLQSNHGPFWTKSLQWIGPGVVSPLKDHTLHFTLY